MRTIAALLLLAAVSTPAIAQERPTGRPDFAAVYGPSWLAYSRPGPNKRPEKLEKDETVGVVGKTGNDMAVQVSFWGDVADLKTGHKYELRYQVRVHTKAGEMGPLLGDTARPNGVAHPLAAGTAGDGWMGLEGTVDITRKDLSAAAHLPKPGKDKESHVVLLRVEPQLYDATAGKYLTPGKTTAIVLAARVWANGKVWEVQSLAEWVAMNRGNTADDTLALLATLDDYDPTASGVETGIEKVLALDDVKPAVKAKFVAAIPAGRLGWKQNFNLKRTLETFADGTDETLKSAAKKKLGEAK